MEGEDPLAPFGPNAARHVRRTDGFAHCPDIMVNSTYWEDMEEVAAFEELVGSHGGMGGTQSYPFVSHPPALEHAPTARSAPRPCTASCASWLVQLGHPEYGETERPAAIPEPVR